MSGNYTPNNKRIAKNTLYLYIRMLITLLITLFTSRVILDSLGEVDYGIYNVVGGIIAMAAVITNPMQSVIERFITFGLGSGDLNKLKKVFSTSVNIQFLFSIVIIILFEIVGVWFLNNKMNIPEGRMVAANWALQCSLVIFLLGINKLPYSATIMAHERVGVYAYLSIFEVICKLGVAYLIYISTYDKLIVYSLLLVFISLLTFVFHLIYCKKNFEEVHYTFNIDKPLFNEMASFAGWSFLGDATYIFNTQGVNILINIFFNVGLNAARGIAIQVDSAVRQFVSNFTLALYPPIMKSYANGDKYNMFKLICMGSKYSFFIMLLLTVPITLETESLLNIWLVEVPDQTTTFLRLVIITSFFESYQHTMAIGINSTGNIRMYQIKLNSMQILIFPLTWILFEIGFPAYITYALSATYSFLMIIVRLSELKRLMSFPVKDYLTQYFSKMVFVALISFLLPFIIQRFMDQSVLRFFVICILSMVITLVSIWIIGLNKNERELFTIKIKTILCTFAELRSDCQRRKDNRCKFRSVTSPTKYTKREQDNLKR